MTLLFRVPDLDLLDSEVVADVHRIRASLSEVLRTPRRWHGGLRRTTVGRAILGSNTIEGYTVTPSDAVAAVDDEPPMTADQRTWVEILGYRRVLTYVFTVATEPGSVIDSTVIRSMHFMLLEHELAKTPGRFRSGEVYVRDERNERTVYHGPDADAVAELMATFSAELAEPTHDDPLVRAAMAHLNLVMIHPFRDGNGRMARALHTMVLAQDHVVEPAFSSIEEWLGNNTQEYYDVLAAVGGGEWNPDNDATLWLKFALRAHHLQAQILQRRFTEAVEQWRMVDEIATAAKLPDRVTSALFDAMLGIRVTRPGYLKHVEGMDPRTATRDLAAAVDAGLLAPQGERRGRFYLAGQPLTAAQQTIRDGRSALTDPYPSLVAEIRASAPRQT